MAPPSSPPGIHVLKWSPPLEVGQGLVTNNNMECGRGARISLSRLGYKKTAASTMAALCHLLTLRKASYHVANCTVQQVFPVCRHQGPQSANSHGIKLGNRSRQPGLEMNAAPADIWITA